MDVKDLRYFIAVYEAEGFSRASRELGTVQSNVSARIRSLEGSLGLPLFERRYRRVAPTAGGDKLYRHAKKVLTSLSEAERARGAREALGLVHCDEVPQVLDVHASSAICFLDRTTAGRI